MSDAAFGNDDRLALEEERSLPWLESGLEEEEDDSFDTRRIVTFSLVLVGLMLLAVAAIWYFTRATGDPSATAAGEVIAAPEGPYKIRPEDRGGREFERTGDSAPTAAEGQSTQAQLAGEGGDGGVASSAPTPSATPASGVAVQIGAYRTRSRAEQAWDLISAREPLKSRQHRIEEARSDIGTVFRLQALAPNAAGANSLCGELRGMGIDCRVIE
ncbi:SPOR domain-containing protein [Pseudoblastomonas halimionae]|uniref:SPOR domain-containing protein n=1 Tax=Alteriqipengyuania halimionae TaxID=1926630 RepID=A0A6I4U490_9SPHN|nr:SPOR domain-containing protein [Alteriqipengyuania halimionae]MXP10174.1 SPOR domain-containing protein [Alteriqipengyuania halimionae]